MVRGVSGRGGGRVGIMGADVVACMGERFVGSVPVAVRSAAVDAWMALRLAGPALRL